MRTPVGGAVGIALAARAQPRSAAPAGLARAAVHPVGMTTADDGRPHQLACTVEHGVQLWLCETCDRPPGIDAGGEAAFALEDVSDPGDEPLVEQGVADLAVGGGGAQSSGDLGGVEILGEDVGSESRQGGIESESARREHAQRRAAELNRLRVFGTHTAQAERRDRRQRAPGA